MIMYKKRGISPLIATVLLVGFVIIIAVAVYLWYGNIIKGELVKRSALAEIDSDCEALISLSVSDAAYSGSGIVVTIKNTGSEIFNGVRVLADYSDKNVVLSEKEMFKPGEVKELTFSCDECGGSSPNKIEVMPMIVRQGIPGTCSSKKVVYNLS